MKEIILMAAATATAEQFPAKEKCTKEILNKIKWMGKDSFGGQMEGFMKGNGFRMLRKGMASTFGQTDKSISDSLKMTIVMEMEHCTILTVRYLLGFGGMAKSTAKA